MRPAVPELLKRDVHRACADKGIPSMTCVTRITRVRIRRVLYPNAKFTTIHPAVPEIQERGTHVRTCRCTLLLAYLTPMGL